MFKSLLQVHPTFGCCSNTYRSCSFCRCTQRDRCQVSTSDRWLFGPPEQTCVAITDVSPSTVSVSERANVSIETSYRNCLLKIRHLKTLNFEQCGFYHRVMHPIGADGMADSIDPDCSFRISYSLFQRQAKYFLNNVYYQICCEVCCKNCENQLTNKKFMCINNFNRDFSYSKKA